MHAKAVPSSTFQLGRRTEKSQERFCSLVTEQTVRKTPQRIIRQAEDKSLSRQSLSLHSGNSLREKATSIRKVA